MGSQYPFSIPPKDPLSSVSWAWTAYKTSISPCQQSPFRGVSARLGTGLWRGTWAGARPLRSCWEGTEPCGDTTGRCSLLRGELCEPVWVTALTHTPVLSCEMSQLSVFKVLQCCCIPPLLGLHCNLRNASWALALTNSTWAQLLWPDKKHCPLPGACVV